MFTKPVCNNTADDTCIASTDSDENETVLPPSPSKNEKSRSMNSTSNPNAIQKSNEVECYRLSDPLQLSSSLSLNSSLRSPQDVYKTANVTEVLASEPYAQSTELRQHVTFPNHFQVPEAFKSGLTFGSFDTFSPSERSYSVTGRDNSSSPASETSPGNDEAVTSSNQSAPLTEHGGHVDYAHSSSYPVKTTLASEGISITDNDSKIEQPKQEVLLTPEGHPIPTNQSAQNYGLNLMSTMLGTHQVQFDGSELQAQETPHLPSFVTASSQAVSPSPTPLSSSDISNHSIPNDVIFELPSKLVCSSLGSMILR
ncbi:GBF-interacting protein 1-like [Lathyrus oleraceus]|uniref:GBF-interacting protein 1-like n=1 Tax=Pisum sativum TaxID=3888 RepID=UPI0021D2900B|nr:GBF-interacting protein 1-like [Pisum sativum]